MADLCRPPGLRAWGTRAPTQRRGAKVDAPPARTTPGIPGGGGTSKRWGHPSRSWQEDEEAGWWFHCWAAWWCPQRPCMIFGGTFRREPTCSFSRAFKVAGNWRGPINCAPAKPSKRCKEAPFWQFPCEPLHTIPQQSAEKHGGGGGESSCAPFIPHPSKIKQERGQPDLLLPP